MMCFPCRGSSYKGGIGPGPTCTPCGNNTYADVTAGTSPDVCIPCPLNTFSATESLTITECTCNAGYAGEDGTQCTACEAGTFKTLTGNSECLVCGAGTFSSTVAATSESQCTSCQGNSSAAVGSNSSEDCSCNPGFYDSSGEDEINPFFG